MKHSTFANLTKSVQNAILKLIQTCCLADQISYESPEFDDTDWEIYYQEENGEITAALFCLPCDDILLSHGYTLPAKRRQGLFLALLDAAAEDYPDTVFSFLITAHNKIGQQAMLALNAEPVLTEYLLQYRLSNAVSASTDMQELILISTDDRELLAKLHHQIFDFPQHASKTYVDNMFSIDELQGVILQKHNEPVGLCFLLPHNSSLSICGLGILPSYRHQGMAGLLLDQICIYAAAFPLSPDYLLVQVNDQNQPALHLYQKYGFTIQEEATEYQL